MTLCLIEHDTKRPDPLSLQALTVARQVAAATAAPLHALGVGEVDTPVVEVLAAYGVDTVHVVADERLRRYSARGWARALADVMSRLRPPAVVAAGTERGAEVLAHLGAIADLPMATNCVSVTPGAVFEVTRLRWAGSLLEDSLLDAPIKLLTVAPHAVEAEPAAAPTTPGRCRVLPDLSADDLRDQVATSQAPAVEGVSLTDARVVVGGGRGVGGEAGFAVLDELAGLLGGAVGVSRVVTSLGWRPHRDQVGQTGAKIAPEVYIACGISGAVQHLAGCRGARHLLAINTDAEAPIMRVADYAVIGDLHEVLPAVVEAVRRARADL